jgi:hypothetical protein
MCLCQLTSLVASSGHGQQQQIKIQIAGVVAL